MSVDTRKVPAGGHFFFCGPWRFGALVGMCDFGILLPWQLSRILRFAFRRLP
jgi:hypothetical protein